MITIKYISMYRYIVIKATNVIQKPEKNNLDKMLLCLKSSK
jgi:hypothetical protein